MPARDFIASHFFMPLRGTVITILTFQGRFLRLTAEIENQTFLLEFLYMTYYFKIY